MQIIKRFPFAAILLIHILLSVVLYLFVTPYFLSDDDTAMMLRVSGRLVLDHPTANVLFSDVFLAYILKLLYGFNNALTWYALYYITVLILSNSIICFVLIKMLNLRNGIILYVIYLLLAGVYLSVEWQFTIISYIAFAAGIALFYFYPVYQRKKGEKPSAILRLLGLGMLLISFLVRYESFMSSFILLTPLLVIHILQTKSFRLPLQFTIVVIILYLFNIYSGTVQDKLFNNYYSFNDIETSVQEYHKIETQTGNKEALAKVNWTCNDVIALRNWFFFDKSAFNQNKFKAFLSAPGIDNAHLDVKDVVGHHLYFIQRNLIFFIAILIFLITIIVSFKTDFRQISITLLMFCWVYFMLSMIAVFLKYPIFRVQFPLLLLTCFICLFDILACGNEIKKSILLVMIAPAAILFIFLCFEINKIAQHNRKTQEALTETLTKTKSYPFVINWGGALSLDCISPLSNMAQYNGYRIFGLGCFEQSDEDERFLRNMGVTSVEDAIYHRHIPVLIDNTVSSHYIPILKTFGEEHYGLKVATDTLFRNDKLIAIAVK